MPNRTSKYRTVILVMLLLAIVINYIDRAALSIAMPFMSRDFHLSAADKGLIFASFSVGYALFNFLGGYFSDRFGSKKVLVCSMSFWSVMCAMTALVSGFWSLFAVRIFFGAGEGPNSATANKVVITWFPTYLVDAKGISLKDMSLVSSLPWIFGALGFLGGGFLVDAIFRKTGKQFFSRKVVLVSSLLIAAVCIGFTGTADSVTSAVSLMTVAIGFLMLAAPAYWAIIQDSVPRHQVGTASGFMHGLANVSGIVGPAVTGFLIQGTGSYASAFVLAGSLGVVGAFILAIFVGPRSEARALTAAV
ncbi:transmembrane sugar transporter [Caballeronia hypogeia]|uniref:Transmembrane sugar transporter n=1 Tax=Caballeronia hypogeia TaxID=1777140 RepID=A0A158AEQ0_9BURK|nr:transmembrane sugar transporter [Caballeronia hypogeia]